MKITKVELTKVGGLAVEYEEALEHGLRSGSVTTEDPPHPDLEKSWKPMLAHILSMLGVGDDQELHTLRSIRFKGTEDVLEADFTILRKVTYSTAPLVWNTPAMKSKADGSGIPDRLHQLLTLVQKEAALFVRKGKTAQEELELEEGEEVEESAHADA
jgi:hypothetical protein